MARYLFDAAATSPSLAAEIARETDGILTVRSLHDPLLQDELDRGRPGWRWEPTLLETDGGAVRVSTGVALRARLVAILGPRRAWRVAQLVAEAQVPIVSPNQSRRGFVRGASSLAAGLAGAVLLGPGPRAVQAQPDDPISTDLDAQARRKPGRYSRREGIRSWSVRQQGSRSTVRFKHRNQKLSGTVVINYSGGGSPGSFELNLRRDRYQVAFSGNRVSGTDAAGRSFTAVSNDHRRRWEYNAQSEQVMRGSRSEFRLGFAVVSDLAPRPRRRSRHQAAQATCIRDLQHRQVGSAYDSSKSVSCLFATDYVENDCRRRTGCDCCELAPDCDCWCLVPWGDFSCFCDRNAFHQDRCP